MKKIIILFSLACLMSANLIAQTDKKTSLGYVNLGLISQLVEIKAVEEGYLTSILNESPKKSNHAERLKDALENYNKVKLQMDRIILQMTADMKQKNSIALCRKLNKHYKIHIIGDAAPAKKRCKKYVDALSDVNVSYQKTLLSLDTNQNKISGELILSIYELVVTTIKEFNEAKAKKVDAIAEILNTLRLKAPAELIEKK